MLFSLLKLWSSGDPYYFEVRHVFEKGGDAQAQKKGEGKKGEKKPLVGVGHVIFSVSPYTETISP